MKKWVCTEQCSFDPLDLSPKFLPIAFLELFGLAFSCFFGGGLGTAAVRATSAWERSQEQEVANSSEIASLN